MIQAIQTQTLNSMFCPSTFCAWIRSVVGPVIQANGKLSFEDDLRSGGLEACLTVFHGECAQCRLQTNKNNPKFYAGEMITLA